MQELKHNLKHLRILQCSSPSARVKHYLKNAYVGDNHMQKWVILGEATCKTGYIGQKCLEKNVLIRRKLW